MGPREFMVNNPGIAIVIFVVALSVAFVLQKARDR